MASGIFPALLLLALGAAGAHASLIDDVNQESSRLLVAVGDRRCHATCDGDEPEASVAGGALPADYQCWGVFKQWCGTVPPSGPSSSNTTEELSGSFCQGHYRSMTFTPTTTVDPGMTHVVVACEGLHHWISSKTATCPHTGKRWKKMMGSVSAGNHVSSMKYPEESDKSDEGPRDPTSRVAEVAAAPLLKELEASAPLVEAREQIINRAATAQQQGAGVRGEGTFHLESRSHGWSVSWKGIKEVPPSEASSSGGASESTWEDLEEEAQDLISPSWRDWLGGGRGGAGPRPSGEGDGPTLTCNHKAAWWHGAAPCWGNFSVSAVRTEREQSCGDKAAATATATTTSSAHHTSASRALRVAAAHPAVVPGRAAAAAGSGTVAEGGHTSVMRAECDGMWTGIFGKSCIGVSTSHLEVVEEGEPVPVMDKWNICSGRQGIRFMHRDNAWGMSVTCKGDAVTALTMQRGHDGEVKQGQAVA